MKYIYLFMMAFLFGACVHKSVKRHEEANFRPQYHMTPPSQWMNDPNGMVYFEGEYHLFYQHYPDSNVWGPMHWGHAVSPDMIRWEHLPIALYPDSLGYIFSGSAVIDKNNTSGLGSPDSLAMIAIFTYHDTKGEQSGRNDFQSQGLAYSLDKGRTWVKYANNPVLKNPGIRDFRDPKVSWNKDVNKWIMILAAQDHVTIYSSPNLLDWTLESEFGQNLGAHGGVWECPDLFPLADKSGNIHWVMLVSINPGGPQGGSATQYFVGGFDGSEFIPYDTKIRWVDYGADNYAGVTWSNIPEQDGRRLFLGWMSNWQYANNVPTYEWRSAMTIPRELKLEFVNNEPMLISSPVAEIKSIENEPISFSQSTTLKSPLFKIDLDIQEEPFELELSNELDDQLILTFTGEYFSINRAKSGKIDFSDSFAATHSASLNELAVNDIQIYLDNSSIELFINGGQLVMTELVFPYQPYTQLTLNNDRIKSQLTYLNPVW